MWFVTNGIHVLETEHTMKNKIRGDTDRTATKQRQTTDVF